MKTKYNKVKLTYSFELKIDDYIDSHKAVIQAHKWFSELLKTNNVILYDENNVEYKCPEIKFSGWFAEYKPNNKNV